LKYREATSRNGEFYEGWLLPRLAAFKAQRGWTYRAYLETISAGTSVNGLSVTNQASEDDTENNTDVGSLVDDSSAQEDEGLVADWLLAYQYVDRENLHEAH
jgi:hypothetical protein